MTSPPKGPPSVVGESDRDTAVQRLQEAYVEGHISHGEMDERLHQVLSAKTHGELATALVSLPEESPGSTSTIAAAGGRIRRRGAWRVPRVLKVDSAMGRVHLDLSRALFESSVVDIELNLGTGRARLTVPRDAVVDIEGLRTTWKDTRYRPRRKAGPGGPVIRVSGTMGLGRLKVRHARRMRPGGRSESPLSVSSGPGPPYHHLRGRGPAGGRVADKPGGPSATRSPTPGAACPECAGFVSGTGQRLSTVLGSTWRSNGSEMSMRTLTKLEPPSDRAS